MTLLINRAPPKPHPCRDRVPAGGFGGSGCAPHMPAVAEVPGRNGAGAKRRRSEAHVEPSKLTLTYLLREIMSVAQLRDELNLRLEPIHVPLRRHQNASEESFTAVVSGVTAGLDALIEPRHGPERQPEGGLQDLDNRLAHRKPGKPLQGGPTLP